MKKKEIEKKLNLNKATVANLDKQSMSKLFGGFLTEIPGGCKRPSDFPPCD